jgi:hypothetical protein
MIYKMKYISHTTYMGKMVKRVFLENVVTTFFKKYYFNETLLL